MLRINVQPALWDNQSCPEEPLTLLGQSCKIIILIYSMIVILLICPKQQKICKMAPIGKHFRICYAQRLKIFLGISMISMIRVISMSMMISMIITLMMIRVMTCKLQPSPHCRRNASTIRPLNP